jgi:hypothetical protein
MKGDEAAYVVNKGIYEHMFPLVIYVPLLMHVDDERY